MGAPLRAWIIRCAVAFAVIAFIGLVLRQHWPPLGKVVLFGSTIVPATLLAYHFLPAFDLFGRVRWRLPHQAREKRCALTFDDGPSDATRVLLDILASEGVSATFFVLGANAQRYPDTLRRAQAEGHAVGIHGMTHVKLARADAATVEQQVVSTMKTLAQL